MKVYPLYGALSADVQQKLFEPAPVPSHRGGRPGRKIICSTNIAEASLTIDGVVYVIDTGLMKQKMYNPRARLESLVVCGISKAFANQRAGRAGRTGNGKCYRLYTKEAYEIELPPSSCPENWRFNLGNVVLQMLTLGISNIVKFDFMIPPAPETLMRALESLFYLGAIDGEGKLTGFGALMGKFPLKPEASAALIKFVERNCSQEMLTIVAMMSEASICFMTPKTQNGPGNSQGRNDRPPPWTRFEDGGSDYITPLNVYNAFREQEISAKGAFQWCKWNFMNYRLLKTADSVHKQLTNVMRRNGLKMLYTGKGSSCFREISHKALLCGYFIQVAHLGNSSAMYVTARDEEEVKVHPLCGLRDEKPWILYHEFVLNERGGFVRTCTGVEPAWLLEMAPDYFNVDTLLNGLMKDSLRRIRIPNVRRQVPNHCRLPNRPAPNRYRRRPQNG